MDPINFYSARGERLRQQRQALGMSLDDVALAFGASISTLSRFERGYTRLLPGNRTHDDYEAFLAAQDRMKTK